MQHPLTEVARFCFVGMFNAQLAAAAGRRSIADSAELALYMRTPEFGERAARLEPRVREGITRGQPVPLRDIAAELALPIDLAVAWLDSLGVQLDVAIGGRGTA